MNEYFQINSIAFLVFSVACIIHLLWLIHYEVLKQKRKANQFNIVLGLLIILQSGQFMTYGVNPLYLEWKCEKCRMADAQYQPNFTIFEAINNIIGGLKIFFYSYYIYIRSKGIIVSKPRWERGILSLTIWSNGFLNFLNITQYVAIASINNAPSWLSSLDFVTYSGVISVMTDVYFLYLFLTTLKALQKLTAQTEIDRKTTIIGQYGIACLTMQLLSLIMYVITFMVIDRDFYFPTMILILNAIMWGISLKLTGMRVTLDKISRKEQTSINSHSSKIPIANTRLGPSIDSKS